jgi:hypothetical protein
VLETPVKSNDNTPDAEIDGTIGYCWYGRIFVIDHVVPTGAVSLLYCRGANILTDDPVCGTGSETFD